MDCASLEADGLIGAHKGQNWCRELKISKGVVFPRLSQPPCCDYYMKREQRGSTFPFRRILTVTAGQLQDTTVTQH